MEVACGVGVGGFPSFLVTSIYFSPPFPPSPIPSQRTFPPRSRIPILKHFSLPVCPSGRNEFRLVNFHMRRVVFSSSRVGFFFLPLSFFSFPPLLLLPQIRAVGKFFLAFFFLPYELKPLQKFSSPPRFGTPPLWVDNFLFLLSSSRTRMTFPERSSTPDFKY